MAEHGSQSTNSSNRDGRAGRENFLRDVTEEESGKSGIVFYRLWSNPDINIISFRHGYVRRPSILTSAIAERNSSE